MKIHASHDTKDQLPHKRSALETMTEKYPLPSPLPLPETIETIVMEV